MLGPGSFPLPTETLQDWAPWAKMPCPGKRQEEQPAFPLVVRPCPCHDGIAFTVRRRHSRTTLFVSCFTSPSQEKHCQNQGSPRCSPQVVAFDCLFELCVEGRQDGLSRGWLVFLFFSLLILSHCIYQLLTHHFEGGGNVALLFVSFFIIFLL
ncbi:hypothetical protein mRhiFer1_010192 [Rhinolophus ferrumequinum]|uniref:Uncharacterized protein n=1 Tax=Rhinolophus ferrumequinum TaxID=59479 RepID=A0A7J7XQP5_RHIFE|nr:hypothetical protein mRhiFer1_010192 [Rhinolophus ferrumequinum]